VLVPGGEGGSASSPFLGAGSDAGVGGLGLLLGVGPGHCVWFSRAGGECAGVVCLDSYICLVRSNGSHRFVTGDAPLDCVEGVYKRRCDTEVKELVG
jgi:hypothetical protein